MLLSCFDKLRQKDKFHSSKMKLLVFMLLVAFAAATIDYAGHQVYRVFPTRRENEVLKRLADLDFWSNYNGKYVDVRVPPALRSKIDEFLTTNKINYKIFIEDIGAAITRERKPRLQSDPSPFEYFVYHDFDEIDAWVNMFTNDNEMATAINVGSGKSYEGRNLRAVQISTGSGRPAFVINCGIHAREWISPATCMYTANKLVSEYNKNATITSLMDAVDFYIVPSSNPDGYAYTWSNDRLWRKTRSKYDDCGMCIGVDPNRNWDFHWDDKESNSTCCSEIFRGPTPFSEIETRNQRDFVKGIEDVRAYIDVHSYSQTWMYPWAYTETAAPDDAMLNKIGMASVAAIYSVDKNIFQTGAIAKVVYPASGSTADYFYDSGIKCSWGAELCDTGKYGFLLPEDQIYKGAEEAFQGFMVIATNIPHGPC